VAPGLIRRAFADTSAVKAKAVPHAVDVDGARAHAKARGLGLLVIVVPKGSDRPLRGQAWGSFLMHGDPADFNLLSLVEVVCATMDEVGRVAPGMSGEPWAVLFDIERAPRALDGKVPPRGIADHRLRGNDSELNKSIDREIAAIGKLIHDGLKGDAGELERLAAKLPLSADDRKRILDAAARGSADADTVDKAAALVLMAAARASADIRQKLTRAVEKALVRRLRDEAPAGSRWDKVWDCPPCGMAIIPPKSARFLSFYVKGEAPPPKYHED
jgi:hypothetical protein